MGTFSSVRVILFFFFFLSSSSFHLLFFFFFFGFFFFSSSSYSSSGAAAVWLWPRARLGPASRGERPAHLTAPPSMRPARPCRGERPAHLTAPLCARPASPLAAPPPRQAVLWFNDRLAQAWRGEGAGEGVGKGISIRRSLTLSDVRISIWSTSTGSCSNLIARRQTLCPTA